MRNPPRGVPDPDDVRTASPEPTVILGQPLSLLGHLATRVLEVAWPAAWTENPCVRCGAVVGAKCSDREGGAKKWPCAGRAADVGPRHIRPTSMDFKRWAARDAASPVKRRRRKADHTLDMNEHGPNTGRK